MTNQETIPTANSFHMLRAMVGIGTLCGLLIVLTYEGTLPRIEQLRAQALQEAIFKVLPGISDTRAYAYKDGAFQLAADDDQVIVYAGYDDTGTFKGVAIEASGQGYADVIRILYGYSPDKLKVVGFYVLESKETPGLGDKIEIDPQFLSNFSALEVSLNKGLDALENAVITVKSGTKVNPWEIDGITGATISSRAIGEIMGRSTEEWVPIIYKNQEVFKLKANE
ncbi:FMN-binding protein [Fulvivirga lutimaris]|uniref:FMN-binding protein n=1 Tax=Fulvivirga lutimaris TaxID=1819566 RepID=UPI0012BB7AF7|nr:FMN-binding protein [Fulvivirga lutimaris]MTI41657.1 FMN-binding protein [Fulvivirga lutimaris]